MRELHIFLNYLGFRRKMADYWRLLDFDEVCATLGKQNGVHYIKFSNNGGTTFEKYDTYWVDPRDNFEAIQMDIMEKLTKWMNLYEKEV